ncbi:MAG TPA: DUF4345 domain-containing protein [Allosphingosinicella sp.]|jgi:hypothetical protein
MNRSTERRLLQIIVALTCLVPLWAGGTGVAEGPAMLRGVEAPQPADLDSHYRYLSGILFAIGLAFAACIPAIERRGALFRTLGLLVMAGGLGRLMSLLTQGPPSTGHLFGLTMELVTVPLLMLWQRRVERRFSHTS